MKLLNNKIAFLVINLCLILGILLLIFLIVQKQNNYKTIVTDAAAENIDIVGVNIEFRDSAQFKAGNLINSPQVGAKIFIHGYFGELSKTDKVYSGLMKVYVNGKEIFKLPVTNQKDDGNLLGISASWTVPQGMSEIAATFEVTSAQDINPKNNILQAAYNSSQKPDIAAYAIDFRPAEYASPTKSISSPVPGQKVYIYANIGELTGTGHPYFGDIDIFIDGKKAHTYTLSTIEAGNIYSAWTQWTVANKPTKIKMVFDASNKLAEVNENNNTFEFTYDPSKKMDLKLTSIEFRSSSEFGTGHKYNPAELTPGMNVYVHAYYQETNTGYG